MRVIQAPQPLLLKPQERAAFLAGSIDMGESVNWQSQLVAMLAQHHGTLLNPRRDRWEANRSSEASNPVFREQVEWELTAMEAAGLIAFYFAPASQAPITLLELGLAARARKAVVCCPEGYWRRGNVAVVCERYGVPMVESLDDLAQAIRQYGDAGVAPR